MGQKNGQLFMIVLVVILVVVAVFMGFKYLGGGSGLSRQDEDKYLKPLQMPAQAPGGAGGNPSVMPPQPSGGGGGAPTLGPQGGVVPPSPQPGGGTPAPLSPR